MRFRSQHAIVLVILTAFALPNIANAMRPDVSIAIHEFQQSWSVEIDTIASNHFLNIVTPDGSVLAANRTSVLPEPTFLPAGRIFHEETFDTLDAALSFVSGDWSTTEVTSLLAEESETFMRGFTVSPIASDDINRSIPVISSPAPDFTAQKRQAFLLAWDYETVSEDHEAPNRSIVVSQRTEPFKSGTATRIIATPRGSDHTGSSRIGNVEFGTSLRKEPGANTNRWLFTAAGNAAFLQTFDIQVGSYVEMDEFIDSPILDPEDPASDLLAELTYSRYAETLSVNLVDRPTCLIPDDGLVGDFDGNGTVAFSDFLTLSQNFRQLVSTYEEGDADCDGFIGFSDFMALSENFGRTASPTGVTPVPEPSTFGLTLCGIGSILVRRRQRG